MSNWKRTRIGSGYQYTRKIGISKYVVFPESNGGWTFVRWDDDEALGVVRHDSARTFATLREAKEYVEEWS